MRQRQEIQEVLRRLRCGSCRRQCGDCAVSISPGFAASRSRNLNAPEKPFAESCVENRAPIFEVLRQRLMDCRRLLEIGSGTGQHAVYFAAGSAAALLADQRPGRKSSRDSAWLDEAGLANVRAADPPGCPAPTPGRPIGLMPFSVPIRRISCRSRRSRPCFAGSGRFWLPGGIFLLYGPFNYDGRFTSAKQRAIRCLAEAT